jgi:hypothetical protein
MVSFVWGGLASVRVPHLSGTWVLGVWGMGRRVCGVGGMWCVVCDGVDTSPWQVYRV